MQLGQQVPLLLLLLQLLILLLLVTWSSADAGEKQQQQQQQQQLSRQKRGAKFTKMLVKKVSEAKSHVEEATGDEDDWPLIAWKLGKDVFKIGDDGSVEDREAVKSGVQVPELEEELQLLYGVAYAPDAIAGSSAAKAEYLQASQVQYAKYIMFIAFMCTFTPYFLSFTKFAVIAVSQRLLANSLSIHFPSQTQRLEWLHRSVTSGLSSDDVSHLSEKLNDILLAIDTRFQIKFRSERQPKPGSEDQQQLSVK